MGELKISTTKLQGSDKKGPEGTGWKSNEVAAEAEENLQMKRGFCDVASLIICGGGVS